MNVAPLGVVLSVLACAAAVAGLLVSERGAWRPGVWTFKLIASGTFMAAAFYWGAATTAYGRLVLVALALCLLGDVLLIPKGRAATFVGGLASFLLGHAAFAAAFASLSVHPVGLAVGASCLLPAAWAALRWLGPHLSRPLRGPVAAYVVVISVMVAAALGAVAAGARPTLLLGACMFAASDVAVARERFVSRGFGNAAWGLPLYFAAQQVLASTVQAP